MYISVGKRERGRERRTKGRAGNVGDVTRPLQEFVAEMGYRPPGNVHDTESGADVELPRRKVDVEDTIHVAEATPRTMAYSTQRLFRTRKLDVHKPIRSCALTSVTQLE